MNDETGPKTKESKKERSQKVPLLWTKSGSGESLLPVLYGC